MSLLAREVTHDEDQKGGNKKMKRDDARRRESVHIHMRKASLLVPGSAGKDGKDGKNPLAHGGLQGNLIAALQQEKSAAPGKR